MTRAATGAVERAEHLLAEHPPSSTEPTDFLLAQYDAGLAWIGDADERSAVARHLADAGAPDPFVANPIAVGMVGPTILQHGTEAQQDRHLRRLWAGVDVWCQLFSEPGAGSDLASLATRAVATDEGWVVAGQKVWTSAADRADFGLLLARTNPELTKNRGLTAFLIDMRAPGVLVRPLRQMTGDAEFNEVFLDGVRLPADARLGPEGEGWKVAFTTLTNERSSIGDAFAASGAGPVDAAVELFRARCPADAVARDRVVTMWIEAQLIRMLASRVAEPGPAGAVLKLLGAEHSKRVQELAIDLLGADGMLHDDHGVGSPWSRGPHVAFLRSRAATIEGGTSEVMRNVLGERVLGLPREPDASREMPWKDVVRNVSTG
jgi:alkylation response protein AidB-like acyl-CoA dehydrogenase